jgi:peptidoglycan/xylan/chitin deacetylase (PgdA/CDA1 family)
MIGVEGPPAGLATWSGLQDELDRWCEDGRCATLWWRDDDAVAPSRRLDELLGVAGDTPVALAVIPAPAQRELAMRLRVLIQTAVRILQHGWRHHNYGGADGKKNEFPLSRPTADIAADLARGRDRLKDLFGAAALPVLAPPWNRLDPALLPVLAEARIAAVSQIKPRRSRWPAMSVYAANVHVDLVAWRGGGEFVGEAEALGAIIGHLQARREGRTDPDEPTGILTHHLVQDGATGRFLSRLLAATRGHRAARWLGADEVFRPGLGMFEAGRS